MSLTATVAEPEELLLAIDAAKTPLRIATLNPEMALEAGEHSDFREAISRMSLCSIDGTGLYLWARFAGLKPPKRYHGADLVHDLFERYQDGSRSFYLLGGAPGVAATAKTAIERLFPGIKVVGADDGGRIDPANVEVAPAVVEAITKAKPDVLLVGFGAPKQELWMDRAQSKLHVPVMIGVGGTIEFYASKSRSPHWMSRIGLEWLYRGFHERGHWRRVWRAVVVFSAQAFVWILTSSRPEGKQSK